MSNPYAALGPDYQQVPMNVRAEAALLGALLSNNRAIERCVGLRAEHFAGEGLGEVFQAIVDGIGAGHVVDAVLLARQFPIELCTTLLAAHVGIPTVGAYSDAIQDAARHRAMIEIFSNGVEAARTGVDPAAIATLVSRQIDELTMGDMVGNQSSLNEAMDDALAAMERARRGETSGISTGFPSFDKRLGGLEPGLMYVLAGRPGMGKSAIGHQIAISAARKGVGVLELSLEMSTRQLGRRTLSSASGVPLNRMKAGIIDLHEADRIVRARRELADLPLTIDDTAGQTPTQIALKARAAKRKHDIGLVMIDHLNLMAPEAADAKHGGTWATERASGATLQIAKELGVPVLLLAQLNRGVEAREDKRPVLSDLRQAGAIEQDAYAVGFVYRAEYYNRDEPPEMKPGESTVKYSERTDAWYAQKDKQRGGAELIWAKVRDGETGTDKLMFDGPTTSFTEVWP